ncbi:methyltransferase domain-containing protein [Mesorhizobium sp.]|uniref:methyltransferase domain-containing protein n=1 Tax=Mesorhizobium sp. TaxID=1871066 RepID=UPI000FE5A6F3|nr:methyltransferase domain-containing protein [Mesorhizobium sp.]RWH78061.1 MAG: methyltransferase domain-containing protein [Mesorhizobium sp.]
MKYTYVEPPLPSLARWRNLYSAKGSLSCLRALQYEELHALKLEGPILDVGGGQKSLYKGRLPGDMACDSVNIDPKIAPTFLISPGDRFPVADASYRTCLCFNTLEHVYDAKFLLDEMHRVLKPGGVAHITVPFIFRIHGAPDDYFRGTSSWWRETLGRTGFAEVNLQPLVWGRNTSAGSIRGYHGILPRLQFHLSHLTDILYARLAFSFGNGRYTGRRGERTCAIALGYFITARK